MSGYAALTRPTATLFNINILGFYLRVFACICVLCGKYLFLFVQLFQYRYLFASLLIVTSNFDHARIIDSIPGVGKLYYWHHGRGSENKKSIAAKDYAKATKDTRLFKKQLGNSDDKRLFIETNLDRFKKMKLQENFQSALNRNKAVINKLEKIPATANVQTRLGQLKAQREQILNRYLEVADSMN